MSGDLHHIDDLFKSGIDGKEEAPSPSVWENIEKELDKKDSRPKFIYWWNTRRIAAAALILLGSAGLFAGGYYFGTRQEYKKESRDRQIKNNSSITTPGSADPGNSVISRSEPNGVNTKKVDGQTDNTLPEIMKRSGEDLTAVAAQQPDPVANSNVAENKKAEPSERKINSGPRSSGTSPIADKKTVRSEKNKQPFTETFALAQNETADPDQLMVAGRKWEPEMSIPGNASRNIPGVQMQIDAAQKVSSPVAEQSISTRSIPVLNKKKSEVDLPRFSLTPVAGLQFGTNKIVTTNDPHSSQVKSDIERTESQPMSISWGILADLKISRNLTVQSGLVLTNRTIEIEPKFIKAERNPDGKVRYKFDCSAGTYYIKKATYARPGDSAMTTYSSNELNYLNIPLALTYHFGGKKLHLFATAGAGLNLLTDQYLETGLKNYNYDENESIATNLKSRYFNGMIGAGLNYRPFKKISFIFSPQYQFALSPMNENMPVKAYPRIFNMQLGMQIRL